MNYNKAYLALRFGDKLPRKTKKTILGKKISNKKLKSKLKVITESEKSVYEMLENGEIENLFCPNCGCEESFSIHYPVEYPDVWNEEYCSRCKTKVGLQDNSYPEHILNCEGFTFD